MFIYFFPFFSNHSPLFHHTSTTYTLSPTNVSRIFFSFLCFFFFFFISNSLFVFRAQGHASARNLLTCVYMYLIMYDGLVCVVVYF